MSGAAFMLGGGSTFMPTGAAPISVIKGNITQKSAGTRDLRIVLFLHRCQLSATPSMRSSSPRPSFDHSLHCVSAVPL